MSTETSRVVRVDAGLPSPTLRSLEALESLTAMFIARDDLVREIDGLIRMADGSARGTKDEQRCLDDAAKLSSDLALLVSDFCVLGLEADRDVKSPPRDS